MIFELAQDFHDVVATIPREHPKHRNLSLLEEAIRRDIHFIARHPTTLFQCMWNTCWWYDCPEAAGHYEQPRKIPQRNVSSLSKVDFRLNGILEAWRTRKASVAPTLAWIRSVRPPLFALDSPQGVVMSGHASKVNSVAFSPCGRYVISGSDDRTVRVWETQTGLETVCSHVHVAAVTSVAVSPDGRQIVSGSKDRTLSILDTETGRETQVLRGHEGEVTCVAVSPDGARIASGSTDNTVRIWDAQSGLEMVVLPGQDGVTCVAFSPDGQRIAASCERHVASASIRVWDLETRLEVQRLSHFSNTIWCVAYSPNGKEVAITEWGRCARVLDAETGQEKYVLRGSRSFQEGVMMRATYSPDGRFIATASAKNRIWLWDAQTGNELSVLGFHEDSITALAFSTDGRWLVSGSADATLRIWDCYSGGEPRGLLWDDGKISCLAFSRDGTRIATGRMGVAHVGMLIWDVRSGTALATEPCQYEQVTCVAFSPDGRRIVSGGLNAVSICNSHTGREERRFREHFDIVTQVAFLSDGQRILSKSKDEVLRILDSETGKVHEVDDLREGSEELTSEPCLSPLSMRAQDCESVVVHDNTSAEVAWFPVRINSLVPHPVGRLWAGAVSRHLHILALECVSSEADFLELLSTRTFTFLPSLNRARAAKSENSIRERQERLGRRDVWYKVVKKCDSLGENMQVECLRCGGNNTYDPRWGDKPPQRCPFCGFPEQQPDELMSKQGDVTSSQGDSAANDPTPLTEGREELPVSAAMTSPPPQPQARGSTWNVQKLDGSRLVFDATCFKCGYSEEYDPRAGDRLPLECPKCGYKG